MHNSERHAQSECQRALAPNLAPKWGPGPLPDGLYVRENDERDQSTFRGEDARRIVTWRITGRNPQFWWDIVLTHLDADAGRVELHCTRCGHRDQASSMDDLLRLIQFGAHFHNTHPAGGF